MTSLIVGVGQVSLLLRFARSLKDKRHVTQSLRAKLRNRGFAVTECGYADEPKRAALGFAIVSGSEVAVHEALDEASKLFIGDFDVVSTHRDIFDYAGEESGDFEAVENFEP